MIFTVASTSERHGRRQRANERTNGDVTTLIVFDPSASIHAFVAREKRNRRRGGEEEGENSRVFLAAAVVVVS